VLGKRILAVFISSLAGVTGIAQELTLSNLWQQHFEAAIDIFIYTERFRGWINMIESKAVGAATTDAFPAQQT
jgi:hypothetical protein